jgi:hypothetical protein
MPLGRIKEALTLPHRSAHTVRPRFQNIQSNAGKIHRRDMLPPPGKK